MENKILTKQLVNGILCEKNGAPGGSRTPDQQNRNLLLYPTELRAHDL